MERENNIFISSKDLKNRILKNFKRCSPPIIFDRFFKIETKNNLKKIIEANSVSNFEFIDNLFDCNRFARGLISKISFWQSKKEIRRIKEYKFPICIGFCFLESQESKDEYHSMNIALCEEGFFLIEPQTDEFIDIINPNKILFIEF